MNLPPAGTCPVCDQEYADRVVVERGDRWPDIHAGTPTSFFNKYARRCSAPVDTEQQQQVGRNEVAVYFHAVERPGANHSLF